MRVMYLYDGPWVIRTVFSGVATEVEKGVLPIGGWIELPFCAMADSLPLMVERLVETFDEYGWAGDWAIDEANGWVGVIGLGLLATSRRR